MGLGTAAAVLFTPWNTQRSTAEMAVEGHPEWGARVERAPGDIDGDVTVYERGRDGQPDRDLARRRLSGDRLVAPGAPRDGAAAFGTSDATSTIRLGADLEAALAGATGASVAAGREQAGQTQAGQTQAGQTQAGQEPAAPSTPPLQTGYGFEIRDAAESAIVADGQAQGKSQQQIQTELDNHRRQKAAAGTGGTGTGGVQESVDATPDASDPMLAADPARQVMGPGRVSHPGEVEAIRQAVEAAGVEVVERPGNLGYQPGLTPGEPGKMIIDPDASYSAWLHEYQHALDDQAAGWSGFRIIMDTDAVWQREQSAYNREIEYMRSQGHEDAARQLESNMEAERKRLYGLD